MGTGTCLHGRTLFGTELVPTYCTALGNRTAVSTARSQVHKQGDNQGGQVGGQVGVLVFDGAF